MGLEGNTDGGNPSRFPKAGSPSLLATALEHPSATARSFSEGQFSGRELQRDSATVLCRGIRETATATPCFVLRGQDTGNHRDCRLRRDGFGVGQPRIGRSTNAV